jgi:hypothetical protein
MQKIVGRSQTLGWMESGTAGFPRRAKVGMGQNTTIINGSRSNGV